MSDQSSDDPFAPRDGTVLRPRPGAGRRPGGETSVGSPFAQPAPRTVMPAQAAYTPAAGNLSDFLSGARNPIVQAAAPLLTLGARLSTVVQQANIATLRQQAIQEVRSFEERMRTSGVAPEDSVVARYILCTFVDSAVLNTPWGAQGDWAGQSLLVVFHKEVSGGEKFFEILERLRANPARYIDLIELAYVCLALGYEGKFRHDPAGPGRLGELHHDLFPLLRDGRQLRAAGLSPHR
jgi:type VI secretion system protein ImpK